jgi:sigma-B regulation protein RsbQ
MQRNNVRVVGSGQRTLVFAHGFGTDQTAWRHQEAAFAGDHRLVLFDHVGVGGSDLAAYSPRRYQSLHSYAADVLEVLAELDIKGASYVGHSMSAMIGLLAAKEEPERFERMIFVSASPRYLNDEGYHGGFEQKDMDALHEAMASNYHAWASGFAPIVAGNPEQPELALDFARTLSALRPDISLAMSRLIYASDHRADLGSLKAPTLIIQSRQDVAVPVEVGEYLSRHILDARMSLINARGHLPHMSSPAAVIAAIRSFLD